MFSETEINEECTFIEHSMRYVFVAKSFSDLVLFLALWMVHPSSPLKPLIKNFYQPLFTPNTLFNVKDNHSLLNPPSTTITRPYSGFNISFLIRELSWIHIKAFMTCNENRKIHQNLTIVESGIPRFGLC